MTEPNNAKNKERAANGAAGDSGTADSQKESQSTDFIRQIINADLASGKNGNRVCTRFPPEPNGYLHIGHAKSICLNFGIAQEYPGGVCHLRMDDTNPCKEEMEYVESIHDDVRWLGFDWGKNEFYASDYFQQLYDYAVHLIKTGKAYVCSLSAEQVRQYRGTLTEPGRNSPDRDRPIAESLALFEQMRDGKFPDGAYTLRAKIDMTSGNINMRDPALYRIRHEHHHRTGDKWCIYPMYDYAHCISDAIEGITHSICTLEFEDHRPLYDWILDHLPVPCHPQQIEFARLNLNYTVLSKRKLLQLVTEKHVNGWDDPRMPTLRGMRRRGYTPEAIRELCSRVGVAKANNIVDLALLEFCLREDLNKRATRRMAILKPLKLVIDNYPEGQAEKIAAQNNPEDPDAGSRELTFSRELYIEREDFMEDPPKNYFRLAPGREVRLLHAYYVTATEVVKDPATGEVIEVHCTYDPETKGGWSQDGRKVKGTIHWLATSEAVDAEVRLFDHLFSKENPDDVEEGESFLDNLNPNSLQVIRGAKVEPSLKQANREDRFQFVRHGYFCIDYKDSAPQQLVFNRAVALRDSWAKAQKKG